MPLFKKKQIVMLIVLICIITALFLFPTSKEFNKTFNDAFVTKDYKSMSKKSTVKITAKITKRYSLMHLRREKMLDGLITIDNKQYIISANNLGYLTTNSFYGYITENSTNKKLVYIFFMSDDLNSIYLSGFDNEQYIAAPAKTIGEFEDSRKKASGK